MNNATTLLDGHSLTPQKVAVIATGGDVQLCEKGLAVMAEARQVIESAIRDRVPVYGVTTGLGPRVTEAMPDDSLDMFSLNTIRGRAHGVGSSLDSRWVRAGMAVRVNTLLLGAAGARPALAEHLVACLNAGLTPVIPETGTIGVADLCWGGALGMSVIGEGKMITSDGNVVDAKKAMEAVDIVPFNPQPREGLALVSHSTITAGLAAVGWVELKRCYESQQTAAALSMEGFRANLSPLDSRVLELRAQPGQSDAAMGLRQRLEGSKLISPGEARRLQDPLSLRNVAQVHGTFKSMLDTTHVAVNCELNGASDNPAVLIDDREILSNGGYLPPHLCVTLTALSQAVVHATALQVSRISKLLVERFSGLSNGLSAAGAEGAGLGPIMKTAETLYAEITHLATPPPIYPGISADGLEDVVTHTAIPAKSLLPIAARLRRLCAIEGMVAAQAIDLRELRSTIAPALRPVHTSIREISAPLSGDRALGSELEDLALRIDQGAFDIL